MTKLKIPDGFTEPVVTNLGVVYPVKNGHIDIPEAHVHDGLFAQGFTVAPKPINDDPPAKSTRITTSTTTSSIAE